MGWNYYVNINGVGFHLGKSSVGHMFNLNFRNIFVRIIHPLLRDKLSPVRYARLQTLFDRLVDKDEREGMSPYNTTPMKLSRDLDREIQQTWKTDRLGFEKLFGDIRRLNLKVGAVHEQTIEDTVTLIRDYQQALCSYWNMPENSCACCDTQMRDIEKVFKIINSAFKASYYNEDGEKMSWNRVWSRITNQFVPQLLVWGRIPSKYIPQPVNFAQHEVREVPKLMSTSELIEYYEPLSLGIRVGRIMCLPSDYFS